ncbi:hypothetical protein E2F47_22300, partial [Mycobacterium eburneum]
MTNPASDWTTPNQSVHYTEPAGGFLTPAQFEAYATALLDGFLAQVLLAVANISIGSVKPFAGLKSWANDLESQASNALATANGAQTTATNAQSTATTANTNANDALSQLESLISGVSGTVIGDVTNAINTAKSDATTAATDIENMLSAAGQQTATALGNFISTLLGPNSPLNAGNIIGTLFPQQVGPVPISQLANIVPQLLTSTDFGSADEVDGGGVWSVANGAVSATANGTQIQLFSPGSIPVTPGQVYNLSATSLWSGVTGGTNAISLMVAPYLANTVGTLASIAQVDNPAASSTGTTLSGTYTVPASGVDSIRLVFSINPSATAGSVSFKAPSAQ